MNSRGDRLNYGEMTPGPSSGAERRLTDYLAQVIDTGEFVGVSASRDALGRHWSAGRHCLTRAATGRRLT
jgi:hypothetical protein